MIGDNRFREGDKVMQVRNNYQAEWTRGASSKEEEGLGVFINGQMTMMNLLARLIDITYAQMRQKQYIMGT